MTTGKTNKKIKAANSSATKENKDRLASTEKPSCNMSVKPTVEEREKAQRKLTLLREFMEKRRKAPPRFTSGEDGQIKFEGDDHLLALVDLTDRFKTLDYESAAYLLDGAVNGAHGKPTRPDQYNASLLVMAGFMPKDQIESMLAAQMTATHSVAMEFLRRASHPDHSSDVSSMSADRAAKLLRAFAAQVEVLDRHRGKGQQKIVVEHVTVEAGGQAIVGQVNTDGLKKGVGGGDQKS